MDENEKVLDFIVLKLQYVKFWNKRKLKVTVCIHIDFIFKLWIRGDVKILYL